MKSDFENALKYYNQTLENQLSNAKNFVRISTKIGNICHKKGNYDLPLDYYYQKTLNNSKTSPSITSSFISMGIVYHRQHHYDLALEIYKHVLSTHKHLLSNYDLNLVFEQIIILSVFMMI